MIRTVFWISLLRLWNNKQEMLLALLVPIMFFSIFAMIFSRGVGQQATRVSVAFIDDDKSNLTERVIRFSAEQRGIEGASVVGRTSEQWKIDRLSRFLIGKLDVDLVVYFPHGYERAITSTDDDALPIQIMDEGTNSVGKQIMEAVLQQAVASNLPQSSLPAYRAAAMPSIVLASSRKLKAAPDMTGKIRFTSQNAFAYNKHNPKIAMYAAGIAVMFLLFSANGAGGSLLEEKEAGTLERLLCSNLTISHLFIGKWLFITWLGLVQLITMFAWGQIAFGVNFLGHLPGFFVLAVPTAGAAASSALLLAALCKSRNQLNGVSVIVVLSMSALGGSMIPRYIMSESMQKLGKLTFNGWALDGFTKIFWYDMPASAVRLEVGVLCGIALVSGIAARLLAPRWSTM